MAKKNPVEEALAKAKQKNKEERQYIEKVQPKKVETTKTEKQDAPKALPQRAKDRSNERKGLGNKNTPTKKTGSGGRGSNNQTTKNAGRRQLTPQAYGTQTKALKESAIPQAAMGFVEGAGNALLSPVSLVTGKKVVDFNSGARDLSPTNKGAQRSRTFGSFAGTAAGYMTGYGAVQGTKAFGKATEKLIGTKGLTSAAEKLSRKMGQEASQKIVTGLTRSALADATVGTVMDLGTGRGEGLEGKDLAKYMGVNAALNVGLGGAMEFAPAAISKIVSNTSIGRASRDIDVNAPTSPILSGRNGRTVNIQNDILGVTADTRARQGGTSYARVEGNMADARRTPMRKVVEEVPEEVAEVKNNPRAKVEAPRSTKNGNMYTVQTRNGSVRVWANSPEEAVRKVKQSGETLAVRSETKSAESAKTTDRTIDSQNDSRYTVTDENGNRTVYAENAKVAGESGDNARVTIGNGSRNFEVTARNPKNGRWEKTVVKAESEQEAKQILSDNGYIYSKKKGIRETADNIPGLRDTNRRLQEGERANEEVINNAEKVAENANESRTQTLEKQGGGGEVKETDYTVPSLEQSIKNIDAKIAELKKDPVGNAQEIKKLELYRKNAQNSKTYETPKTRMQLDDEISKLMEEDIIGNAKKIKELQAERKKLPNGNPKYGGKHAEELTQIDKDVKELNGMLKGASKEERIQIKKEIERLSNRKKALVGNENLSPTTKADTPTNTPTTPEKIGKFDVETSPKAKAETESIVETGTGLLKRARGLYQKLVSGQSPIERMAKKSGKKQLTSDLTGIRNSRSTTNYIVRDGLVGRDGKKLVKGTKADGTKEYFGSYADLFKKVGKENLEDFNTYATHLHNIDRWKQGKPVFTQTTEEESKKIVEEMLKKHPEFAKQTKEINEWWNAFVDEWLVKSGRLSKEAADAMREMYPNYVPTYRADKRFISATDSMGNRVSGTSGIKKAKGGTSDVLPIEDQFLWYVDRIVEGTRKNEFYADFVNTIKNDPKKFAEYGILTEDKATLADTFDNLMDNIEKANIEESKAGKYTLTAYVDGKPVTAQVSKEVAEAIRLLDNPYGNDYMKWFANIGKPVTGAMKTGITGLNPIFALTNGIRDFSTVLVQSEHSIGKTLTGMGKALGNIVKDSDLWEMYKAGGGKNSGYFAQGKGFQAATMSKNPVQKTWNFVKTVFGAIGETTESVPRFAEFLNTYEKLGGGEDAFKRALNAAAEVTVDFSRSAPVTKAADGWILYLNAAVQGLDKFARTVAEHPVKTLGRSTALITVPYAFLMAKNWSNPYYQDLSDRTKQMYYCIPNVNGEFDEEGNAKTFIKIPVNREYGAIMGSSLDMFMKMFSGQENPAKQYKNTLATNFLPPDAATDNFLTPLLYNVQDDVNKDFAGRAIVPSSLTEVSAKYQYDSSTSGVAKGIANAVNFVDEKGLPMPDVLKSPKKVDYLIDSYAGIFGDVAQGLTDQSKDKVKLKNANSLLDYVADKLGNNLAKDLIVKKFTADPRFSSQAVSTFYDDLDKVTVAKNDAEHNGNGEGKERVIYNVYNSVSNQLRDSYKAEKEILNNNRLSQKQRDQKIKELREERNEIAKSAKGIAEGIEKDAQKAVDEFKKNVDFSGLTQEEKDEKIYSYIKKVAESAINKNEVESGKKTWDDVANEEFSEAQLKRMKEEGATAEETIRLKDYYASLGLNASSDGSELYNAGKKGGFSEAAMKAYSTRVTDNKIEEEKSMTPEKRKAIASAQESRENNDVEGGNNAVTAVAMFYDGKSGKEILSAISKSGASKKSVEATKKTVRGAYMVASTGWDIKEYQAFFDEARGDNSYCSQDEADAWFKKHPEYTPEQAKAASYLATKANKYLL